MRIERRYTKAGQSPYAAIAFRLATSEIRNPDGSTVFRQEGIEVPEAWSQVATDVLAQKYFRKAGVPARLKKVEENAVPSFLWRGEADEKALAKLAEGERTVSEHSAKQVFDRLAGCWAYWGWKGGYFTSEEDASAFYDELRTMLAMQMCAPNSPQWFNTGLHWAYGIDGPAQGHYYVDHQTGELVRSQSAYEHPQPHACMMVLRCLRHAMEPATSAATFCSSATFQSMNFSISGWSMSTITILAARRVVPPDLMAPAARSPILRKLMRPEERPPPESFSPSPRSLEKLDPVPEPYLNRRASRTHRSMMPPSLTRSSWTPWMKQAWGCGCS